MAAVQEKFPICQQAFMSCLGSRETFAQEAAARGLSIIYEKGDRELKDTLVKQLMSTFADNKPSLGGGQVSGETQLFDEDTLLTNDGSVSTYKDVLNLASEMGNPGLVYKFMSLASNNAIWNSRAAVGRFGLSSVFSDSSVNGYLASNPRLYPILYRYLHDPNATVQRSMKSLWESLVKDPRAAVAEHFDRIMKDLLESIVGREWRAREASCRAISSLVQDQKFEKYEAYTEDIWKKCFLVMDDIKGSVREAAQALGKTLSNTLIRSLEAGGSSKAAKAMLSHVIPFLLAPENIETARGPGTGWAIRTLIDIVSKSEAKVIEPFAADLVSRFIPLFTSLEPGEINYIHMKAEEYNTTTQELDEIRLRHLVRGHPLMRCLEKLLTGSYADESTIANIVIQLESLMKSSVGFQSQAAISRCLVHGIVHNYHAFKPYADRLMRACHRCLTDRNETIARSYAHAIGYLFRGASDDGRLWSAKKAWNLWKDSENAQHCAVAAEVFESIAKYANEAYGQLADRLMPYVCIGRNDEKGDAQEAFQEAFDTGPSTGSRRLLLHLTEILELATPLLDNARWRVRHAAVWTVADVAGALKDLDASAVVGDARKVWPALKKALEGKSWDGKERVLEAFVGFSEKARGFWESDEAVRADMDKVCYQYLLLMP